LLFKIGQSQVTVNSVTICKGTSAILTASGGSGNYIWSTSETTNPISVTPASTTTYTVTDAGDASKFAIATVTVGPVAVATPSSQTICSGTTNNAVIALSSNVGGATSFTWTTTATLVNGANPGSRATPGNIVQTLTSSPNTAVGTATYTIVPANGACVGSAIIATILINPKPRVVFASQTQTICSGSPVSIALASSFSGTTLDWTISEANTRNASAGTALNSYTIADILYSDASPGGGQTIYSVIPQSKGCIGNQVDFFVNVNQTPVVSFLSSTGTTVTAGQTICSGRNTKLIKLTSDMVGTYYTWHSASNLPFLSNYDTIGVFGDPHSSGGAEMDTIPVQAIFNSSSSQQVVTYSITVNACITPITEYKVYVEPVPHLTVFPTEQQICSGDITNLVNLTADSPPATTTYKWSTFKLYGNGVPPAPFISGLSPSFNNGPTNTIPSFTLSTNNTVNDTVVFIVTITNNTLNSCKSNSQLFAIIKPLPNVISTPSTSDTICSDSTSLIVLSSDVANTTFNWSVNPSGLTGATNSPFPAVGNNDSISQALHNALFIADSAVYTITGKADGCTGNPYLDTVRVDPTPDVTTSNVFTICSDSTTLIKLTSHVAGTTYSWVANMGPNMSGASNGSSTDTIQQTLHNSDVIPGTVVYTVTPSANGCLGLPYNITVTINPTPDVIATPAATIICSDSTTKIVLTSNVAGTTYNWTVVQSPFVTGASAGSNDSILQILNNAASTIGFAIYTITPIANGCMGLPITYTVIVNPTPNVLATPAIQTICSDSTTMIALSGAVVGTTYSWTVDAGGLALGAFSDTNDSIQQKLTNTGFVPALAVYSIIANANACPSAPMSYTVTVNPTPSVIASNKIICSGDVSNVALSSLVAGTAYSWTVDQSGVTGASSGVSATDINQTLTTTGPVAGTATYTIIPTANGCPGLPFVVVVTVKPTPTASANAFTDTICSNTPLSIALSSNLAGTTYAWSADTIGVLGANLLGITNPITQTLTATRYVSGLITFTIIPTTNGCAGTPLLDTITVTPIPDVVATPTAPTICSGGTTGISLSSNVAATSYSWTVVNSGVTGASAGFGSNITQTLTATSMADGTATYSITPMVGGCSGTPISVVVVVKPLSIATPAITSICSGNSPNVLLTSPVGGTTFDWTVVQTNVSGAKDSTNIPNNGTINQNLTAVGVLMGSVVYTVTPSASGCAGLPILVTVVVNPVADISVSSVTSSICSGTPTNIGLSSSVAGVVYDWTVVSTGVLGTANVSNGASAVTQTLTATGNVAGTAVYAINAKINGCSGTTITSTVTVNPLSTATPASQTICTGSAPHIKLLSPVAGTTFDWTVVQFGVSGASDAVNTDTITQILSLTGSSFGTAAYTITPSANGCAGLPIVAIVRVEPFDKASFNYLSSTFCPSGTNPKPDITGTTGGTFSSTPAGMVFISTTTGEIDLSASTLGTYVVKYKTNGVCIDSSNFGVTISNPPSAAFTYVGPYCKNGINPTPSFFTGVSSAGKFTSTPGLVYANPYTGEIDLTASLAGTYTVTNTISCGSDITASTTLIILPVDNTTFNYLSSTFCKAGTDPTPQVTGLVGGTFSAVPAGLVFVSTTTGKISLSASSVGTYTVTYTNSCQGLTTFVVNITNLPSPGASFSYAGPYCQSSTATATPTFPVGSFPGEFTAPVGIVFANKYTGLIDLKASAQGTYTVINTYDCSGTIKKDSSVIVITQFPSFTVPVNINPCVGNLVSTTSFVNIPTYTWINSNSSIGLAAGGTGNVPAFIATNVTAVPNIGIITVTSTLNGCIGNVSSYTITVQPKITADAGNDITIIPGINITLGGNPTGVAGSTYVWTPASEFVDNTYGNPVAKPQKSTMFTVVVTAGGCSATDSVLVTIQPQFVPPGGITPNGDGVNDTWVIDFLDFYPSNTVEIYNRWGELVFQATKYDQKWDGMLKGKQLPVGTYYYIINLNDPTFPDAYTGPVTIMR
jgi:gliding motility-associated-like protein